MVISRKDSLLTKTQNHYGLRTHKYFAISRSRKSIEELKIKNVKTTKFDNIHASEKIAPYEQAIIIHQNYKLHARHSTTLKKSQVLSLSTPFSSPPFFCPLPGQADNHQFSCVFPTKPAILIITHDTVMQQRDQLHVCHL